MKNKKLIYWGIGVLLAIILLVIYFKSRQKPTGNTDSFAKLEVIGEKILRRGMVGTEVESLQRAYNVDYATPNGKTKLDEDGDFGGLTEAAIFEATGRTEISLNQWNNLFI